MTEEVWYPITPITTPTRAFHHEDTITACAIFPDRRHMVAIHSGTLCLWDLQDGVVMKNMEGHRNVVWAVAVSRDGRLMASGDYVNGELIIWDGDTGEPLTEAIKAHTKLVQSLNFSPDGAVLASGSIGETTLKLWCTKTFQLQGDPIECGSEISCVRYSPSGEHLAIATSENIQIWNQDTKFYLSFDSIPRNSSLTWTPDGTRLLTAGSDGAILEWDTLTWHQVGHPWQGHTNGISAIAINPAGTLVASASYDNHVRIWRLSDRKTIAIFQHSEGVYCVTFSMDDKHILSSASEGDVCEWLVPEDVLLENASKEQASNEDAPPIKTDVLNIHTTVRNACISGDLPAAETLLTQEIDTDANNYRSYANRSFVMARKHDWDDALDDAKKSITIQPSLTGCISKGIALCGKGHIRDALKAFDIASMFTNGDLETNHFLLLIKAIALFNADQHEEAILRVQELADTCPNNDTLACRVVEAYLHVQLGINALDSACHHEAADHFAAAVKSCSFSSTSRIDYIYEDLVVLFGWDLESLWLTAHQKRCQALHLAGRPEDALESHRHMMDAVDETMKTSCLNWSTALQQECSAATVDDHVPCACTPSIILGQGEHDSTQGTGLDSSRGTNDQPQTPSPRPLQRSGFLKRLRSIPRPAPPISPTNLPPTTPATTFKARLRPLLSWRPVHADSAAPPVIDVPFAQGLSRHAAAHTPCNSDDRYTRDEDWDSPESHPNTPQPSAAGQIDTGTEAHGRGPCVRF